MKNATVVHPLQQLRGRLTALRIRLRGAGAADGRTVFDGDR
jgi:hypothetical protein